MTCFSSRPLALRVAASDIHRTWYGQRVSPMYIISVTYYYIIFTEDNTVLVFYIII